MSITGQSGQVAAVLLETVNKKLPWYMSKMRSNFASLFEKANPKHNISAWTAGTVGSGGVDAWRIPAVLTTGGDNQVVNIDGGDLGAGSYPSFGFMTLPFFTTDLAYAVPYQAAQGTKSREQAVANAWTLSYGRAIEESALYAEIDLFQNGTGVLATANGTGTPSGTNPTYNLELTSSYTRIRGAGQLVDVYDTTLATPKGRGLRVSNIGFSTSAPTITLSGTVSSPANTDVIVYPGMTGGISAGSYRSGIYTYSTTNTTGSLCGLPYATAYELATCQVNGGNAPITPSFLFSGWSQLNQRRDQEVLKGLVGVTSMAQRVGWYLVGFTMSNNYVRNGEALKNFDAAGQGSHYSDTFEAAEVKHYVSKYAVKNRVDWLIPKNYGRVQLQPRQFYSTQDGTKIFTQRNQGTSNPAAGSQFYMLNTENLYCIDPGAGVVFYNAAIPSGQ